MKKILILVTLLFSMSASSYTFFDTFRGLWVSNICKSGNTVFYFNNNFYPVGNSCWFNLNGFKYYGVIIGG